jgi:hypothetical protein
MMAQQAIEAPGAGGAEPRAAYPRRWLAAAVMAEVWNV